MRAGFSYFPARSPELSQHKALSRCSTIFLIAPIPSRDQNIHTFHPHSQSQGISKGRSELLLMSMGRRQKETESPKEYPGSARSDEMPLHYKREVVHLHPVRRHLPDPTCSSLQAMLEAQLPLCPGFPVCYILLSGRFSRWLCQFYSHTAATVEAEDASSSHSQDSGQVHKVISRERGKHVSWPQGYQGVRGGARLE